ncbi:hypothetical protein LGH82_21110 [Mesorhizobium sp. PAMC28654]|uniref:hypothetical protein n=1 Tax=Mesorhizobium sp. PAMC28654 TaxID=2880934 RepID=UPI001D0A13E2|nr:hypothetical protein [Mesorhizobium sp. PAMC28654]UDL87664.1 hypothetical protein LGH82_21110 [Mesorhizobium sp. PAMC28654]
MKARASHDGWCDETRRALDNSHSTLFVFGKPLSAQDFRSLSGLIADRCPAKQFELLAGPEGDGPEGADAWKGDQALWSAHLRPYRIDLPLSAQFSYLNYRVRKSLALTGI